MAREMKNSGVEWIGDIPNVWHISKNKYLLNSMYSGGTPSASNPDFYDDVTGIPFVSIGDMSSVDYVCTTKKALTKEGQKDKNLTLLPIGTILYSIYATVGAVSELAIEATISQAMLALDLKSSTNKQYYKYCLFSMKDYILGNANGNTQFNLNADKVWNFWFPIPDYDEQRRIADFLDRECAEIDAVIEKTKATIEEYKKLKQSIITEAVTKGVRGDRPVKDSGIEWIGDIPAEWDVVRIKALFDYRNERNDRPLEEVNLISLYTDLGVVQHSDLEATTGNKASNADGYKLVYEDDIVVNIILCWMGAIGRSAYTGVTSPAYDVYSPMQGVNSKFYHYLFRTKGFNGECYKVGRGIMAMRWRTYADQFRAIKVVSPPSEEQEEILAYLDKKCAEIETLIAKKIALLEEMESYKKSIIYEYITGKTECKSIKNEDTVAIIYPYFPAVLKTNKPRFAQAILLSRILDKCRIRMGRVKAEKMLYTIENSIGFDFDTEYIREAAGPFDDSIYECEGIISRRNKWYVLNSSRYGVSYVPTKDFDKYRKYYDNYFADYDCEIDRIINIFMDYDADQSEMVATLYAAWNDAILDKKQVSEEQIVDDVLNNWNESKQRFSKDRWLNTIAQMKADNLVPKGYGKHTIVKK